MVDDHGGVGALIAQVNLAQHLDLGLGDALLGHFGAAVLLEFGEDRVKVTQAVVQRLLD